MVLKIHKYDYCIICSLSVYSNYCVLFGMLLYLYIKVLMVLKTATN